MEKAVPYRRDIDDNQWYLVDIFARDWSSVIDFYTEFETGGLRFYAYGKQLRHMIKQCPTFEELNDTEIDKSNKKKKNVCFKDVTSRAAMIDRYRKLFYDNAQKTTTAQAFSNLCVRPRGGRHQNRLSFSWKIVNSLKCDECNHTCVYESLKLFYQYDAKCVAEINYLNKRMNNYICFFMETVDLIMIYKNLFIRIAKEYEKYHQQTLLLWVNQIHDLLDQYNQYRDRNQCDQASRVLLSIKNFLQCKIHKMKYTFVVSELKQKFNLVKPF
uniref:ORF32 protein n=1 Tax=Plutella xylostella granulovirus TaxID=98383 RepID=A0A7U3W5G9_9BBAC|nr:ORF32 protein [Plutella xylostella granulovirus]QKV50075.1 ORF32 protein [Plutella xylostella granulovirus]